MTKLANPTNVAAAMLSHGLFRRYPRQRHTAAEDFASHGYTVEDLDRLAETIHRSKPKNPEAVLAVWLRDADGELRGRIVGLRAEVRNSMAAPDRTLQLEALSQDDRRLVAFRGIAALVSDDWALTRAVASMNDEFRLAEPITVDEAKASVIVGWAKRTPSDHAKAAIASMCRSAKTRAEDTG